MEMFTFLPIVIALCKKEERESRRKKLPLSHFLSVAKK